MAFKTKILDTSGGYHENLMSYNTNCSVFSLAIEFIPTRHMTPYD